jgi:hypothetical protein
MKRYRVRAQLHAVYAVYFCIFSQIVGFDKPARCIDSGVLQQNYFTIPSIAARIQRSLRCFLIGINVMLQKSKTNVLLAHASAQQKFSQST